MDIQVIILFSIITIGTLLITYFASKKTKTAGSFYTAGGGLTARQNGLALAGDFMSASRVNWRLCSVRFRWILPYVSCITILLSDFIFSS